jgi:hypothetical protein
MTAETSTSTTRKTTADAEAEARTTVAAAADEVRGALQGVSRQVPQVARASRGAIDDLYRMIDSSSDERMTAGVTLSLGLAIGMLLGGANRLAIALSLIPVAITGFVMADRRMGSSARTSRTGSAAS